MVKPIVSLFYGYKLENLSAINLYGQLMTLMLFCVKFWKVALTITKEESNHWGVFLLSSYIAPLLIQWMRVPDPRDGGSADHPQKIFKSERKEKSNNSVAVGVRCTKKRGSILILLLSGVL